MPLKFPGRNPRLNSFLTLSFFFILLNLADVLLTHFALANGLNEANPLLASNLNLLIPVKIIGIFLIFVIAYFCERKYDLKNTLIAPVSLMGLVVVWNIIQIIGVT